MSVAEWIPPERGANGYTYEQYLEAMRVNDALTPGWDKTLSRKAWHEATTGKKCYGPNNAFCSNVPWRGGKDPTEVAAEKANNEKYKAAAERWRNGRR